MEHDVERDERETEITDAHRAMATRAHANGKVIVLDHGPGEPEKSDAPEGERTPAEIEEDNRRLVLAKREHDEWHEKNPDGPVAVTMDKIDADHAVNSDPDRYVHVPRGIAPPVTMEERVARLEQRLGPETPEEIAHRRERDEKIARDARERSEANRKSAPDPRGRPERDHRV
jgi:hypothetical protein